MKFLLPLLCLAVLLSACGKYQPQNIALVGPNHKAVTLMVDVADTPELQAAGLQGREELEDGTGMLFVFDVEEIRSFWMKDTLIPLDIIFFDGTGMVVSTDTMEPCTEDPCTQYTSLAPAKHVLEVPAGFVERYGIDGTWRIALRDDGEG